MLFDAGAVTVPDAALFSILTFILSVFLKKIVYCFNVAVKSVTRYSLFYRHSYIAYAPEILSRVYIGYMYLNSWDFNRADRIKKRDTRYGACWCIFWE